MKKIIVILLLLMSTSCIKKNDSIELTREEKIVRLYNIVENTGKGLRYTISTALPIYANLKPENKTKALIILEDVKRGVKQLQLDKQNWVDAINSGSNPAVYSKALTDNIKHIYSELVEYEVITDKNEEIVNMSFVIAELLSSTLFTNTSEPKLIITLQEQVDYDKFFDDVLLRIN